jgi:hypothetical protein
VRFATEAGFSPQYYECKEASRIPAYAKSARMPDVGVVMANPGPGVWFHSNRYSADSACEHCGGVVRHEPWCITVDSLVYYAYQIVADPTRLTIGDALILHSLGVIWGENVCRGKCQSPAR